MTAAATPIPIPAFAPDEREAADDGAGVGVGVIEGELVLVASVDAGEPEVVVAALVVWAALEVVVWPRVAGEASVKVP